ncbi:hypothetical protein SCA6_006743, partial [Theobroma cacao]
MGIMENSPAAITLLLLRNMVTSIFIYADKSLLNLAKKYKLLELIPCGVGDSRIARALSQLLSSVNDISVSSRKYEIVRSLVERLIEEKRKEDVEFTLAIKKKGKRRTLREVNHTILSVVFARTIDSLKLQWLKWGRTRLVSMSRHLD